ncbi:hypothetical protein TL16_g03850 [Triparma laevis f. inornata]|uniref:Uncharacterized protein n=1 Tax=Triparma laevis f. inornata TaxID=1714386 RepID=A0A9W7A126_9STRA|nr:hypothetical protein TL16_g03850 [Triparma laevis f. inornata]
MFLLCVKRTNTLENKDSRESHPLTLQFQQVVFVLGGPGSGKGTQCELLIAQNPNIKFFSAGDLLRAERANKSSKQGALINDLISKGEFVPASITVNLLKNAIDSCPEGSKYLIDGFPRNLDNVRVWDEMLSSSCSVKFCLFLDCPENVMMERIIERGKTSGRTDDNREVLKKRFKNYVKDTVPIVRKFGEQEKLKKVEADRPMEVVQREVQGLFKEIEWV